MSCATELSRRLFDPVTLTFDLILIDGRGIVIDYRCAKFGNFSFSCFGFIVWTDRQTDRLTDRQTDADDRYIHAM